MSHFDTFHAILKQGQAVRDSGGRLGADFDRLEQTFREITQPAENPGQRLAAAIVAGADRAELDRGWIAVLLEQVAGAPARMGASQELMRYLSEPLRAELTKHASANYAAAAKAYNAAAKALHEALATVDADQAPEGLVDEPERLRTWGSIPALVTALEAALEALVAAAEVAGVPGSAENVIALALRVTPGTTTRRQAWDAWLDKDAAGRAGRWGRLIGLGVELHAPALEEHAAYRKPAPLEVEYRRVDFGHAPFTVDPEDEAERAAAAAAAGLPAPVPVADAEGDGIRRPKRTGAVAMRIR